MSDDPFKLIGRRLAGYHIEGVLGRGGMATVYYGWDANLQRPAAIKVIEARGEDWHEYARRLVYEARLMARWRHAHIVQVYGAGVEESLYYFAMEYVEGLDLNHLLRRYRQAGELMPHADVLRIGHAVAAALDYAHQQGIVHRDVKPSNIIVTGDDRVMLADFGLALDVVQGTLGEVFGTPHYIAPEQARSSAEAVPQSDLYALGIVLYEMLTGSLPFDDPSPVSLAMLHVSQPPPLPSSINPAIGIATEAVLIKALSKDPADRFPTGRALMEALDPTLSGAQLEADGSPPLSRVPVAGLVARDLHTVAPPRTAHGGSDREPSAQAQRTAPAPVRDWSRIVVMLAVATVILGFVIVAGALILPGLIRSGSSEPSPTATSSVGEVAAPPTLPPTLTSGPVATGAPAEAPTFTPEPPTPPSETTLPPVPTVTTAPLLPTVLYPNGYRLQMFYDSITFYLWNPGSENLIITPIVFEAVDSATGAPTGYRFSGTEWAAFTPDLIRLRCDALEMIVSETLVRPEECAGFNAVRTPDESSPWIFWVERPDISEFRVLWNGEEIGRCAIGAYRCEVFLPPLGN